MSVLRGVVYRRFGPEFHVAMPHDPDNACELVGKGNRGFVVTAVHLYGKRPLL